ncbi:hypothetical protein ACAW74_13850 [Fibrella sp. WM1]|uniref:hypothetical protein n=1 Tax=Fibrella musci TaxID=3242485 RepID=UPI003521C72D
MILSDDELDFLEQQIPELAELATRRAFWQTLASGDHAVVAEDGLIVEVSPDGTRKVLKTIEKPQHIVQRQFIIPRHD